MLAMSVPAPKPMTADQFLVWAEQQSERYELVGGEVVAMSPERAVHSETKSLVWLALRTASIKLNMAVFAPIPSARDSTATAVNPGLFRMVRNAY